MFENNIVGKASKIKTDEIFNALGEKGQYLRNIGHSVTEACKKITERFDRYSDLLYCINFAVSRKDYTLKYKMHLPYTLTKNDVETLTELLLKLKLINEVFYSNINDRYLIEINNTSDLSIPKILTIGCAEKFANKSPEILISPKSFLIINNGKIIKYHVELSVELENNVASHSAQMGLLIKKINKRQRAVSDVFIVSNSVKSSLNLFDNVISLSEFLKL